MNTNKLNQAERGLIEFFNLTSDDPIIVRENYDDHIAYHWGFKNKYIITTSETLKSKFESTPVESLTLSEEPDVACYLTKELFKPYKHESATFRVLNEADTQLVSDFHNECPAIDKEFGEVNIDDPLVVGAFENDDLVAIASIWTLAHDIADIGIIVKPSAKKKGYGVATVSFLVEEIIDKYVPIYRADFENTGSRAIYKKLGFQPIIEIRAIK